MRIVLCFLLALVAAPTWAEWVKVAASDTSIIYIDPASIRKGGNFRKVWVIQDLNQRDKDGEMSRRSRTEFDCKEERSRPIAFSTHSESMAGGETLSSDDVTEAWSATPPGSVSARILKIVCASVAAPDLAKWVKVDAAVDGSFTYYIDPASIRKDGNLRKVREIQNLNQRDEEGEMSRRLLSEYDCKEERSRILAISSHSEPMAGGVTLLSENYSDDKWSAIPPDSVSETILKRVCAK